ncbi:MAG: hypothetical protein HZC47_10920 [Methanobacterium sp.]|uniref:hypothetical protein n=1 Tax=Methanobacterium sp. TaxID=2164 RepID=UPI003D64CB3D|nr:hypothetical protein [Methanobacterium sp.]
MVTNEEISRMLQNKREGTNNNGYLVCDACEGYYELQPGESSEKFNLDCECGGRLIQSSFHTLFPDEYYKKDYKSEIFISYFLLLYGGFLGIVCGIYLYTRDDDHARFHGKIIIGIGSGFLIFVVLLYTLLYFK